MIAAALALLLGAPPDAEKLAQEYLRADPARRARIERELAPVDEIAPADVEAWRERLLKWAAKAGDKLRKSGTSYLYDKREKRGKYIVGGSGSGAGGLVLALHGGGAGAGDAGEAAGTFGPIASKFKCVMTAPEVLEKTEKGWTTSGTEPFVLELIEAAKRTWPKIPHDRIYIVGHSMGGYGSWTIGARHADLFAGLGPYAGAPTPYTLNAEPYGEVLGIEDGVLPNVRNVALHVYQSLDDKQVPAAPNVFAMKRVAELKAQYGGYTYRYVEVDGRGHGAPEGGHVRGFEWLYEHARDPRPKRVLWQPVLSYKRMFYWLWWDRPVPGAIVDVEITGENEIRVDLAGHSREGFRLLLDDRLVDLTKDVVVREGGEEVFRGKVPLRLTTMLRTAAEKHDTEMIFPGEVALR